MLKLLRQEGFASILEVIVASVIFVVTALGAFSSIAMLRSQGGGSTRELEALYIGKRVMDDLRGQVYGNLWASGPLSTVGNPYTQTITVGARTYTVTYSMVDTQVSSGYPWTRRMDMTVQY